MDDKTKRQQSILHPLANNNQLLVKTVDTNNTANNNCNSNNSSILSSSINPQQQQPKRSIPKNVAYPPMYSFNISTANTLKNGVSTKKVTSGLPVAPDGYIYVKGYGSGSVADHIPRNIPSYYPRRGTSITNNYTESSAVTPTPLHIPRPLAPPHLLQPPNSHQQLQHPQQQHDSGETTVSPTLEVFNTLNPRKAPNMTYKEKIMNWMSSIPQFNDSENNEIYIDCYPGVISTSVTPSTSDEEIDLADIEDILELQARKVTRYVTRLYIRESENWEEIPAEDGDGDFDGRAEYEVEDGDDDVDDDDVDDDVVDYDEDKVQVRNYVYRNANLNIAYETD
ncbi:conserved hypothetical protein [Candida dubliniensis CD36]|uniref:Uncharacterized protein n=1 Tax=Candida dubliniensis (strain CD36 / ATCC MYA-646 / CBS 7987 / NCPF 3949 / NRRL Y-17841) TaxID=573826 RepID=B9WG09_CANDC|nr:conserved hypothetical protein [Candida dubliniensis CD36]CAX42178.1 conserved hypothetical protein [Candida dubliniensis CD36]